ncbi:uncharacterized protein LOC131225188 isoform X2 [Magnolia sinica]|uniref:uncharacterized protein LOC131225188 isoform X2 n=1 Tax=Magnolia sinica TaxID=86752 RepID=UPI002657B0F7|nr:uncharacterized protein LOC131225188 isoform X2 [Magnolia sinica]
MLCAYSCNGCRPSTMFPINVSNFSCIGQLSSQYILQLMAVIFVSLVSLFQLVKVYLLNDGKWDDKGTGRATVDYLARSEDLALFVIDEEDSEMLLLHRISSDDIYQRQEDKIISWQDPELSTELALSFQEVTGCSYIWDHFRSVQRNQQYRALNTSETPETSMASQTRSNSPPSLGLQ